LAPESFEFTHVIYLAIAGAVIHLLRNFYKNTKVRILKYSAVAESGGIMGIVASYVLAHIITPILGMSGNANASNAQGFKYFFWSIFLAMSFLGIIIGGLGGIFFYRRQEEKQAESGERKT
jgi:hypothetical protein